MLLIHQIPPRPAYLRVKIGRHLQRIGAVAIKNSVYALPRNDETQEDFQWVLREVVKGGGDASIVEARFVDGLSDEQVLALFQSVREADYLEVAAQCLALGYPAIKLHAWGDASQDAALGLALREHVGDDIALMYDGSAGFDLPETQRRDPCLARARLEERTQTPRPRAWSC